MIKFNRFPGGKPKCFTLSYDDGNVADRRLVESINRYGVRATFHLNSGLLDTSNRISESEVRTLYQGHEVSTHSATHPNLTAIPVSEALQELTRDRAKLEEISGGIVRGMSYPYGQYNDMLLSAMQSAGICYSRTTASTHGYGWPQNFLTWHPTCHHKEGLEAARTFMQAPRIGGLLYIWGHSYEFNRDNNWELLEEICRTVTTDGGEEWYQKADSVWLATNIEIYEYITAVRSLVVSMDGKIVHNPSATDVWVDAEGEPVQIPAGTTMHL